MQTRVWTHKACRLRLAMANHPEGHRKKWPYHKKNICQNRSTNDAWKCDVIKKIVVLHIRTRYVYERREIRFYWETLSEKFLSKYISEWRVVRVKEMWRENNRVFLAQWQKPPSKCRQLELRVWIMMMNVICNLWMYSCIIMIQRLLSPLNFDFKKCDSEIMVLKCSSSSCFISV